MADENIAKVSREAIQQGRIPEGYSHELFEPNRAVKGFQKHEAALDAVIWSVEEGNWAFSCIVGNQGGARFRITEKQDRAYQEARMEAARRGLERYDVCSSEIIAACAFLARRWWDWNSEGRPLITQAYKIYLAAAVRMLKMTTDMTFDDIKEAVGHQGNSSIPTLDVIWPDWAHEQKERLSRTLQSAVMTDGPGAISAEEIAAFANFIDQEHQDALFLRLHSFERHAFQDLDSPIAGMLSDLQGMAVTIEHVIRVLIGSDIGGKDQLYDLFLKLWTGSVEKILTGGNTLARQGLLKFGPGTLSFGWLDVKAKIEKLRSSGTTEAVVADLLMAHRLRGAVHYQLPENDQFEIEGLFVGLLRAAAMTHAHVQRQKRVDVAASNAIKAPGGDVRDIEPPAEETDSRQHGQ